MLQSEGYRQTKDNVITAKLYTTGTGHRITGSNPGTSTTYYFDSADGQLNEGTPPASRLALLLKRTTAVGRWADHAVSPTARPAFAGAPRVLALEQVVITRAAHAGPPRPAEGLCAPARTLGHHCSTLSPFPTPQFLPNRPPIAFEELT